MIPESQIRRSIAFVLGKLRRRFYWLDEDVLLSAAGWSVAKAVKSYRLDMAVFSTWMYRVGLRGAVDALIEDRAIRRDVSPSRECPLPERPIEDRRVSADAVRNDLFGWLQAHTGGVIEAMVRSRCDNAKWPRDHRSKQRRQRIRALRPAVEQYLLGVA